MLFLNTTPLLISSCLQTLKALRCIAKVYQQRLSHFQFSPCWKEIIIFPLKGVVRWKGYSNPYRKSLHVLTNISDDKIRFIEIRLVGFIATNPIYKELVRWHHFLVGSLLLLTLTRLWKAAPQHFQAFLIVYAMS